MYFSDSGNKKFSLKTNKQKYKKKIKWNYKSKIYSQWRKKVYNRDLYKCRVCGNGKYVEAHHIKMKSKYPGLAFIVSNGITLCKKHHNVVTGAEDKWIVFFQKVLRSKNYNYTEVTKMFKEWKKKLK